jgi:protoporphyrinogen oxidase
VRRYRTIGYKERVATLREELEEYPGLHLVGRNGMHKYNNQDHSIMTAMLVSDNIINQSAQFDPWCVNQDAEYIEKGLHQNV